MAEACGGFGYSDLDHCVQLVGYNDSAPEPYFKVCPMRCLAYYGMRPLQSVAHPTIIHANQHQIRNSWATTFGMDGHVLLSSKANTCGLADEATFVTVSQPADD